MSDLVLRPMFRHYGGKWRLSSRCSPPRYGRIVEPFAGGAGYALRYGAGRRVDLIDAHEGTCAIWSWLLGASQADVMALPVEPLHAGEDVRHLGLDRAPMLLIQRWLTTQGKLDAWRMTPMLRRNAVEGLRSSSCWDSQIRQRIADQLPHLDRWTITHGHHTDADTSEAATWHVDPPYQDNKTARTSSAYGDHGAATIDYAALGEWCRTLPGQVMVHEQHGATWLPFTTLNRAAQNGSCSRAPGGGRQHEVWWTSGTDEEDDDE